MKESIKVTNEDLAQPFGPRHRRLLPTTAKRSTVR